MAKTSYIAALNSHAGWLFGRVLLSRLSLFFNPAREDRVPAVVAFSSWLMARFLFASAPFFWRCFALFSFDVFQNGAEMFIRGSRGMRYALVFFEDSELLPIFRTGSGVN